jgi:hypothetical protein
LIATGAFEYGDLGVSGYADSLIQDNDRRCASVLLRITGQKPPRRSRLERTEVPVTQDELATMAGLSRTTLVQVLRRWEHRGLIEQGYRTLRIVDVPALRGGRGGRVTGHHCGLAPQDRCGTDHGFQTTASRRFRL